MLEDVQPVCGGSGCERTLDEAHLALRLWTDAGERRAYECDCGAVTVTVARRGR